jgi:hypothetical protein
MAARPIVPGSGPPIDRHYVGRDLAARIRDSGRTARQVIWELQ